MADAPIQLGPFTLTGPIGRGGMGVVWGARHEGGEPVAVKVLAAAKPDPVAVSLFEREVRAVAALDHPHVVTIYDYGTIPAEVAAHSGDLPLGSPYLVMERLPDGSLRDLRRAAPAWPTVRDTLLALLDALAHAHAHGVVHRDLKASNVLRAGERVVLTDFGLAHTGAAAPEQGTHRSGTPSSMAPEQFAGAWRDFGPWTDLYALGVLAWSLVTGGAPFGVQRSWSDAAEVQQTRTLPAMRPRVEVPAELAAWLARLLARDPGDRYGRAADARLALLELGPPRAAPRVGLRARVDPEAVTVSRRTGAAIPPPPPIAAPRPPQQPRPLDPDWPPVHRERRWLHGAGLGVFGLRTLPLVGRDAPRRVLWEAARQVLEHGRPRAVVLRGPAGTGKSRLAEWACQTLDAVGAMQVLSATHAPLPGPSDGLGAMMSRWLRIHDLDRAATFTRTQAILRRLGDDDDELAHALTALALAGDTADAPVRLRDPRTRHRVLARVLRRLGATGRPPAVWLDDVQWGLDTLHGVMHLMGDTAPMLLILTARDEALADQLMEAAVLDELMARDDVDTIGLGPLEPAHRAALVGGLLGLGPALADEVERRTAGNPLFAVQLVGDWVHRGLLQTGARGFELADQATLDLPDDVHAVWTEPIARLVRGLDPDDVVALELAALLGPSVDGAEWRAACAEAEVAPTTTLIETLARRRLARAGPRGELTFVHGMLVESLVRRVDEGPDAATRHRTVADALATIGADRARVGRHLLAAGEVERALEALLAGAEHSRRNQESAETRRSLALARQALARLGASDTSDGAMNVAALEADLLMSENRLAEGEARCRQVADRALAAGQHRWAARALLGVAGGHLVRREHAPALTETRHAIRLLRDVDDPLLRARARTLLAVIAMGQGRHDEARAQLERARDAYQAADYAEGLARCAMLEGVTWEQSGAPENALSWFEEALTHYDRVGAPLGRTAVRNGMALAALSLGDHAGARAHMDATFRLARTYGGIPEEVLLLDQATIELADGQVERARDLLLRGRDFLRDAGHAMRRMQCEGRLVEVYALLGDRDRVRECLERAEPLLERTLMDRHMAGHLTRSGPVLQARGWADEARRAWVLARHQWRGLGDPAAVAEAEAALEMLAG